MWILLNRDDQRFVLNGLNVFFISFYKRFKYCLKPNLDYKIHIPYRISIARFKITHIKKKASLL